MYKFKIVLVFAMVSMIIACNKDCYDTSNPECVNYNPCLSQLPLSAKFRIFEGLGVYDMYWGTDTLLGGMVHFESDIEDPSVKHTWYIGAETFHSKRPPSRSFSNVSRPQTINVTHVIKYVPDTVCNPLDDGYDSVTQSFYLIERYSELGTYGTFRGVIDHQSDSFEFSVQACHVITGEPNDYLKTVDSNPEGGALLVINFHNLGDTNTNSIAGNGYVKYGLYYGYHRGGRFLKNMEGNILYNDTTGEIAMYYRGRNNIKHTNFPDTNWHSFVGRKLFN